MRLFSLVLLIAMACSSSAPQYSKNVAKDASGAVTIRLESVTDMSASNMRAALYTEAARATIDQGDVYLRVDENSSDSSIDVKQTAQTEPDPVTKQRSANVGLSRHRSGVIRFRTFREKPASGEVYSASDLLDRIQAGTFH